MFFKLLNIFLGIFSYSLIAQAGPALLWEGANPDGKNWSEFVYNTIEKKYPIMIDGAEDMPQFCSNYDSLSRSDKIHFWGELLAGISKYESGFNTNESYLEKTLGVDPVTKKTVRSEGLLQLSYQDKLIYSGCNFDPQDPKLTPQDPYLNLDCGLAILNKQLKYHHKIAGAYWSTLMAKHKNQKIKEIQSITQDFCSRLAPTSTHPNGAQEKIKTAK